MHQFAGKASEIGHAHAAGKALEHHLVVGGVAHIDPVRQFRLQVAAEQPAQHPLRTRPLVVIAKPAVDVDGAHRGRHPFLPHHLHHGGNALRRKVGEFAVVDGDVGHAAGAVACQHRTGDFAHDALGRSLQALGVVRAGGGFLLILGVHFGPLAHQSHGAVLGHQGGQRPLTCKRRAPAQRAAGDGDDRQAGRVQGVQRLQRFGLDLPVAGERVVDVRHHALKAAQRWRGGFSQRARLLRGLGQCGLAGHCGGLSRPDRSRE